MSNISTYFENSSSQYNLFETSRHPQRVLIGNICEVIDELLTELIIDAVHLETDITIEYAYWADEVTEKSSECNFDLFILYLNNIFHRTDRFSGIDNKHKSLRLLNFIKKTYNKPIIVMSSSGFEKSFYDKATAIGASEYLKTPFSCNHMMESIRLFLTPQLAPQMVESMKHFLAPLPWAPVDTECPSTQ